MADLVTHPRLDAGLPLRPKMFVNVLPVPRHGLLLDLAQMRIVDFVRLLDVGLYQCASPVLSPPRMRQPARRERKQNPVGSALMLDAQFLHICVTGIANRIDMRMA